MAENSSIIEMQQPMFLMQVGRDERSGRDFLFVMHKT
jgi:hypothetical protein